MNHVIRALAFASISLNAAACGATEISVAENKTPMDYTTDGLIDFSRFHFKLHQTSYEDVRKALGEPVRPPLVVGGVALGATYYFPHTKAPPPPGVPAWSFAFAKNQNFVCNFSFTDRGTMDAQPVCNSNAIGR